MVVAVRRTTPCGTPLAHEHTGSMDAVDGEAAVAEELDVVQRGDVRGALPVREPHAVRGIGGPRRDGVHAARAVDLERESAVLAQLDHVHALAVARRDDDLGGDLGVGGWAIGRRALVAAAPARANDAPGCVDIEAGRVAWLERNGGGLAAQGRELELRGQGRAQVHDSAEKRELERHWCGVGTQTTEKLVRASCLHAYAKRSSMAMSNGAKSHTVYSSILYRTRFVWHSMIEDLQLIKPGVYWCLLPAPHLT